VGIVSEVDIMENIQIPLVWTVIPHKQALKPETRYFSREDKEDLGYGLQIRYIVLVGIDPSTSIMQQAKNINYWADFISNKPYNIDYKFRSR
jgi:hypothetical protein